MSALILFKKNTSWSHGTKKRVAISTPAYLYELLSFSTKCLWLLEGPAYVAFAKLLIERDGKRPRATMTLHHKRWGAGVEKLASKQLAATPWVSQKPHSGFTLEASPREQNAGS